MIEPDLTRAAADEAVALPFGYIATVGTCLIYRVLAGIDFSGMDVSSAPQSNMGVRFAFVLAI